MWIQEMKMEKLRWTTPFGEGTQMLYSFSGKTEALHRHPTKKTNRIEENENQHLHPQYSNRIFVVFVALHSNIVIKWDPPCFDIVPNLKVWAWEKPQILWVILYSEKYSYFWFFRNHVTGTWRSGLSTNLAPGLLVMQHHKPGNSALYKFLQIHPMNWNNFPNFWRATQFLSNSVNYLQGICW